MATALTVITTATRLLDASRLASGTSSDGTLRKMVNMDGANVKIAQEQLPGR